MTISPEITEVRRQLAIKRTLSSFLKVKKLTKKRQKRRQLLLLTFVSDAIAIVSAFMLSNYFRWDGYDYESLFRIFLTILPLYLAISLNNKAYQVSIFTEYWKMYSRSAISFIIAASSMLLILFFFKSSSDFSRIMFGIGTLGALFLIGVFRFSIFKFAKTYLGESPYADLCVYDGIPIQAKQPDSSILASDHLLEATPNSLEAVSRLGEMVSGMDCIIVHCPPEKREDWVFMLSAIDIKSEIVVPELNAINPLAIKKRNGQTSLLISDGRLRWDQQLVKRTFDIVIAMIALVIASPVLLAVAIIIKLDSKGPIFFKQKRIGLGNRPFSIFKFRSMRTDVADADGAKLTEHNDPRVTTIGKFIRRTSIDEMPQLLNVLGGSMSLVGPRPHAHMAKAGKSLYWEVEQKYWHRHCVKPGITGLAQVSGHRGNTFVEDDLRNRLNADLIYVANWSLLNDIKILIKTAMVLSHPNAF